ncbi:adenylate/guanylate cyclase domain-containing protein [Roseibium algae]|uniref:Adenylate/guanylate cyclase domain-containing protein n=1 Tax=Roseibium algae TaxID=3123038 RepID=A0ABU8TRC2_9HYPH
MERARRRLAAVMCADVAHYSKLMEADEDGTLDRLKSYRSIMSGLTERHHGRIVNTWGDAVIIEFSSVVEAVQCGVDIQSELSLRNSDLPDAARMDFRIGINLGDLMIEGDDIYGDGVNVAARLQELAPTGGIMLSQSVHDQVRSKLALGFESMGPQNVKNVSEPVEAFSVRLGGRNSLDEREYVPEFDQVSGEQPEGLGTGSGPESFANGFDQLRGWLSQQPKKVRRAVFVIGFFFVLNLLTSGLSTLWFVWPSLPFLLYLAWHILGGSDRGNKPIEPGSEK